MSSFEMSSFEIKSRPEIKALAKESMKKQRATAIGVFFLFLGIVQLGALPNIIFPDNAIAGLVVLLTLLFVDGVLFINQSGSYAKIYRGEDTTAGEFMSAFSVNYLRKVGGAFLMWLFTFLWSLLFFVPGIIKGISYSMAPYILAEYPNVKARDAIKLSMRMTNGHKMDLFVLSLSFIGWFILFGLITGILAGLAAVVWMVPYILDAINYDIEILISAHTLTGITVSAILVSTVLFSLWLGPYVYTTYAGYYNELKDKALATGVVREEEFSV